MCVCANRFNQSISFEKRKEKKDIKGSNATTTREMSLQEMLQKAFGHHHTLISHKKPIVSYNSYGYIFHIRSKDKRWMNVDINDRLSYWRSKLKRTLRSSHHSSSESKEHHDSFPMTKRLIPHHDGSSSLLCLNNSSCILDPLQSIRNAASLIGVWMWFGWFHRIVGGTSQLDWSI